jgi:predicted benzoate:H+ symporter BenE
MQELAGKLLSFPGFGKQYQPAINYIKQITGYASLMFMPYSVITRCVTSALINALVTQWNHVNNEGDSSLI